MKTIQWILVACFTMVLSACTNASGTSQESSQSLSTNSTRSYVADYAIAKESVLRAIPSSYINTARTSLKIMYVHTSHGTHVSFGMYGLQDYKSGDNTLFAVSNTRTSDKLYFEDHAFDFSPPDLSNADTDWPNWIKYVEGQLDASENADINVVMWSWCDISGHNVDLYLSSMQTLINEYSIGGSKIGSGTGKRTTPVTFIFMTGHAVKNANIGTLQPKTQADKITAYCNLHKYYCIDYYSIDTHDMSDKYWSDAGDDGDSSAYALASGVSGGTYFKKWQDDHTLGTDWFENKNSPGGAVEVGNHNYQHITANRKAYAMWYVLARIAGY